MQLVLQLYKFMIYWLQGRETHVMSGSEQPSLNKIVERFDGRLTESDLE